MFRHLITRNIKLTVIVVAVALFSILPILVHSPYYLDLLIMTVLHAVLAMTFVMLLRNGMINLGIAAFWGMGAYVSTVLVMNFHITFWLSLPTSSLITACLSFGLGYILIGSGSTGFGFVILSAIIGMLFSVVVGSIPYLGGYSGISNIPPPESIKLPFLPEIIFGPNNKAPYFYLILILLAVVVIMFKLLYASRIGRAWTSIGLNPRLAESVGVNVFRFKLLAFVVASAVAGLFGSFYAHYVCFVLPDNYGMWMNIYIQIYAILGGMGYAVLGPLIGSGLMTLIPEFMRMASEIAPMITGALLVLLILYLPGGIIGLFDLRQVIVEKIIKIVKTVVSSLSVVRRNG